jgi:hypothetical protein
MRRAKSGSTALLMALWVAASATTTSGCGFLFVDAPPANAKKLQTFTCTTSNTFPTADLVAGGFVLFYGGGVGLAAAAASSNTGGGSAVYALPVAAVAGTALLVASAVSGYSKTSACREATAELMMRLYPNRPGTPGYAPPNGFAPPGGYAPYPQAAPPQPYDPWAAPSPPPAAGPPPAAAPPPPAPAPPPGGGTTPR